MEAAALQFMTRREVALTDSPARVYLDGLAATVKHLLIHATAAHVKMVALVPAKAVIISPVSALRDGRV